jgi:hypothetical protein
MPSPTIRALAALPLLLALAVSFGACGDDVRGERNVRDNEPPTAVLLVTATAGTGDQVVLDASGSDDPDGRIVRYTFATGIGAQTVITASPQLAVRYSEPGEYLVRLTVEDDDGARAAVGATLAVLGPRVSEPADAGADFDAGSGGDAGTFSELGAD